MRTKITNIGNSRGVRIPKPLLEASGITGNVELEVKKGEIRIVAVDEKKDISNAIFSEKALAADWNKLEEDKAWESLK